MIFGSVCSGIEAASVAWEPLGWKAAWYSEIEPFPCQLLQHYYAHVPNLGDMLKIHETKTFIESTIDVLVGGTPCQSFSIAGLRGGLADPRGNLALQFCRILTIKRPRYFIWENVPGVFSSNRGKDFRSIIQGFRECGYSLSWRVLDAQFFGVPQRRRRVFVVGYLGNDWRPSASVLFEPKGLRRDSAPGRGPKSEITGTVGRSSKADRGENGNLIVFGGNNTTGPIEVANALQAGRSRRDDFESESFVYSIMPMNSGKDYKARQVEVTQPLTTQQGITDQGGDLVLQGPFVRRLTPLECERLQGFPDGYTAIPGADDSPRYESLGNSMAVDVMAWIGGQIDYYDKIFTPHA